MYKYIQERIDPALQQIAKDADKFKKFHDAVMKLRSAESPFAKIDMWDTDTLLEGEEETDESYVNRYDSTK
jgi:hypothetical protein